MLFPLKYTAGTAAKNDETGAVAPVGSGAGVLNIGTRGRDGLSAVEFDVRIPSDPRRPYVDRLHAFSCTVDEGCNIMILLIAIVTEVAKARMKSSLQIWPQRTPE